MSPSWILAEYTRLQFFISYWLDSLAIADRGWKSLSRETLSILCMCKCVYLGSRGESAGKVHELTIDLESGIHSR